MKQNKLKVQHRQMDNSFLTASRIVMKMRKRKRRLILKRIMRTQLIRKLVNHDREVMALSK